MSSVRARFRSLLHVLVGISLAWSAAGMQGGTGAAPTATAVEDFDALLRRQEYFKKIVWSTDASFAPFEILIQKQAVPEPGFEQGVVQFFGPWLRQMAKVFDETVVQRAQLPPGTDARAIRLIVLASEGDFVNYQKTLQTLDGLDQTGFYDERIRAVVTYWDSPGAPHQRRYAVLRRFVFALLHQRSTAFEGRQAPYWLREGLATALAWHTGDDPTTAFAKPQTHPELLGILVGLSQDVSKQNQFLMPLESLAAVTSYADLHRRAQQRAAENGAQFSEEDPWYWGFFCEAALWVEYLRREGAPRHNEAFHAYLRAGMRGGGSPADLRKSLEGQDLPTLDREFFRWTYARMREAKKGTPDESRLSTLFEKRAKPNAATDKNSPAARAAKLVPIAQRLALPPDDPRLAHALALREAATGDIEAALARLAAAIGKGGDEQALAGLRREVERLSAWKSARDAWLTELAKSGGRLQLERDGKSVSRRVTALADGALTLESAQGKETLRLAQLAPAALAGQMKSNPPGAPEWVRAYAFLLAGDARFEKQLKDKSPEAQALRADAAGAYVELRLLGAAAAQLAALAAASAPADAAAASEVLDRLRKTMQEVAAHPLVVDRTDALRALAELAAVLVHDETKPVPMFAGKTVWIDEDTVEITYDFDSANELDDWTETPVSPTEKRFVLDRLTIPDSLQGFAFRPGFWAGRGGAELTHVIPFEAPMHLLVQLRHGFAEDPEADIGHFLVGICSSRTRGYLAFAEGGESFLNEVGTGRDLMLPSSKLQTVQLGELVTLEIAHDGTTTRYLHLGTAEPELPANSLRSGEVFVLVQSDRELLLDSIKIRGRLGPTSRERLRERWIANAVREAGLR